MRTPPQRVLRSLAATLLLLAPPLQAFELEGTADFEIWPADPDAPVITVVTVAGFDLDGGADDEPGDHLVLFAEYGPAHVSEATWRRAGQVLIDVPAVRLSAGVATRLQATDFDVEVVYQEWVDGGRSTYQGTADAGWVEIRYVKLGDELVVLDASFGLRVLGDDGETRVLEGVMFGGDVPRTPRPAVDPGPQTTLQTVDRGCSGSEVVVVPVVDSTDEPYRDESGCDGDDFDSGSAYDDSESCSGDDFDSGSSDNDNSGGPDCEGDDYSTSAGIALRGVVRDRQLVPWLTRHIHLTLPMLFLAFARRRQRDLERESSSTARRLRARGCR